MKRFFDKINKTNSCWIWNAAKRSKFGYGAFKFEGKTQDAHRVSWKIHFGEIPNSLHVCHKCDNPSCVNPEHLFLGTPRDNVKDCIQKGRFKYPEGDEFKFKHGNLKQRQIPEEVVLLIKKDLQDSQRLSLKKIALKYNVSYQSVRDISCGRTYRESPMES